MNCLNLVKSIKVNCVSGNSVGQEGQSEAVGRLWSALVAPLQEHVTKVNRLPSIEAGVLLRPDYLFEIQVCY